MPAPTHKKPKAAGIWLFGHHAVAAALGAGRRQVFELLASPKHVQRYADMVPQHTPVRETSPRDMDARFADAVHQGIAARVGPLPQPDLEDILDEARLVVLLDQISDPHNLGAVVRSCAAFGADAVVLPAHGAAPLSPVAAKAAAGALETVPVIDAGNLNSAMKTLQASGFWLVGLDGAAEQPLGAMDLTGKTALVLGSEGHGLRDLVRKNCDLLAHIPIVDTVESLNVSVSAGVALYEAARQRSAS